MLSETSVPSVHACAVQTAGRVVEQVELAHETFRLRIACPEIARRIVPGQFFMVRPAGSNDPLLGRPFALYDVWRNADGELAGIDFVYHVIGKMTGLMSDWAGGEPVESSEIFVLYVLPTGLKIGLWVASEMEPKPAAPGGIEIAFIEISREAVRQTYENLEKLGLKVL